jgi:hypothetical protein
MRIYLTLCSWPFLIWNQDLHQYLWWSWLWPLALSSHLSGIKLPTEHLRLVSSGQFQLPLIPRRRSSWSMSPQTCRTFFYYCVLRSKLSETLVPQPLKDVLASSIPRILLHGIYILLISYLIFGYWTLKNEFNLISNQKHTNQQKKKKRCEDVIRKNPNVIKSHRKWTFSYTGERKTKFLQSHLAKCARNLKKCVSFNSMTSLLEIYSKQGNWKLYRC